MLPDIVVEALRFFDRAALEGLQMHSRDLRDLVNHHARSLPLRKIHCVTVSVSSQRPGVRIQPLEDYCWRTERSGFHSLNDGPQVEEFFHCINNCFVDRLTLSFRPNTHPFLYYLRARANDLQCHIRALHLEYFIWENDVREEEIDYALVDFLGVHLKPNVFEMSAHYECCEDNAMLFTHGALRENVKHLAYKFVKDPAPDGVIPELLGVDVVESCGIATEVDPRPWIRKFVEMFKMAGRETDIVRSVTLLYNRYGDDTILPLDLEPLGQPQRSDVPRPHCKFIEEWIRDPRQEGWTIIESPVAKLFVFKNETLAKKLELLVWTIDQPDGIASTGHAIDLLHYVFVLQVVDM